MSFPYLNTSSRWQGAFSGRQKSVPFLNHIVAFQRSWKLVAACHLRISSVQLVKPQPIWNNGNFFHSSEPHWKTKKHDWNHHAYPQSWKGVLLRELPFGDTLDIFPVPDNCWLNGRCSAPLGFAIAGTSECFFLVRWLVADARMWSPSPVGGIGLLNELVVRRVLNGIDSKVHMYW